MAMRLKAVTYKFVNGGGCVDLEEIGDTDAISLFSGKGGPVFLRRRAADKLRRIADTLDKEADQLVKKQRSVRSAA